MVWGFCVYFVYMIPLETDVNIVSKNRSSTPQTISGSTDGNSRSCCMTKEFKKFPSGHETITSC